MLKQNNFSSLKSFFSDRSGIERTKTLSTLVNHLESSNDFVILWGASNKDRATKGDKDCLLYLLHFLKRIEDLFLKKTKLTFIFTDTHAYLNGYDSSKYIQYIDDIIYHIKKHNLEFEYSSNISNEEITKLEFKNYIDFIDEIIDKPTEYFEKFSGRYNQVVSLGNFYRYAERHCNRIDKHSSGKIFADVITAAKGYLSLTIFENEIITKKFQNAAFITYMSREEEFVLPDLPIIRLYSIKSGLRTRPWFIYD